MCLLLLSKGCSARYPIVLLHIRDEDPFRVTGPFVRHPDGSYYCKDGTAGGTAVCVNECGNFAALNNLHEPPAPEPISRGLAVVSAVQRPFELPIDVHFSPFQMLCGSVLTCRLLIHSSLNGDSEREIQNGEFIVLGNRLSESTARTEAGRELLNQFVIDADSMSQIKDRICSAIPLLLPPSPHRVSCSRAQTLLIYDACTSNFSAEHRTISWAEDGQPVFGLWTSFVFPLGSANQTVT